jgi:hypothetical protein
VKWHTFLITVFVLICSFKNKRFLYYCYIYCDMKVEFKYYYNLKRSWHGVLFDYFSYTDIPPNLFCFLCGEIPLGCVLFGHISWNEYIWQWTRTSPFHRTIWLGKSI